jgi:hypothetical protein
MAILHRIADRIRPLVVVCLVTLLSPHAAAQLRLPPATKPPAIESKAEVLAGYSGDQKDRAIAARFAPVFYQRFTHDAATHRFDYITNFDFDGDWIGNNNWEHAADAQYPMRAYIYYSVIESQAYYFITYADYHARDWSQVQPLMDGSMDKVQASEKWSEWLPQEIRDKLEVNHENDLEGVQVIVEKGPRVRVIGIETIAHDRFEPYLSSELTFDGEHPSVYVESQKHGVYKYPYHSTSKLAALFDVADGPLRAYRYKSEAIDPEKTEGDIGYDLLPIYGTFWKKALATSQPDTTFGTVGDFGESFCASLAERRRRAGQSCNLGTLGTSLRGDVAGKNRATLPWGWFSPRDPELNGGVWFLDPARIIEAHFPGARAAGEYVSNPYLGVLR